jgi:TonB family protein
MVVAFATLGFVSVMSMPSTTDGGTVTDDSENSRAAYLAALGETSPALRRARLADFALTYPQDSRTDIVGAQLSVLDAHEASDWAAVTDVLYDRGVSNLDRIASLDAYEAKWGPNLLGGRDDEIAALRERLSKVEDTPPPSRALEEDGSPIPSSIQGSTMAGGPIAQTQPVIVLPPVTTYDPAPPAVRTPVETSPRVIRSRRPRYPRAAQRRGIGAVVELEMDVSAKGRVDDVRIVRVEAERYGKEFARAAERAAKGTRFSPRLLDGEAVSTRAVRKRFRFEP